LQDIDLRIAPGMTWRLSRRLVGKSTLMNLVTRLSMPSRA